ncbi:uncharacterized protein LOC113956688 isoform X2 [Corapipo altera]|uniref:uncharacterized protein LOC113956688 isoform X2 n=1 Tax=Corapipo altera TaxID=415028 RepID=UPI000FD6906A|nr:uncharacterized protein LOC113956688 isoform X2 [Corapipo altera]
MCSMEGSVGSRGCAPWDLWGAGNVLHGGICGEQGMCSMEGSVGSRGHSRSCVPRGVWGAGNVLHGGMDVWGAGNVLHGGINVWGAGDVLHGMCGEHTVPGCCVSWRDVWCTGNALGAVLRGMIGVLWLAQGTLEAVPCGGAHGMLCPALWCRGCPGGCAVWRNVWDAPTCRACQRGFAVGRGVWVVLGCCVVHGMPQELYFVEGCVGCSGVPTWLCCAGGTGLCWGHWVVLGALGVPVAVGWHWGVLWRPGWCVGCSEVCGVPSGLCRGKGRCWVDERGGSGIPIPVRGWDMGWEGLQHQGWAVGFESEKCPRRKKLE